jgi:hypothetical protein
MADYSPWGAMMGTGLEPDEAIYDELTEPATTVAETVEERRYRVLRDAETLDRAWSQSPNQNAYKYISPTLTGNLKDLHKLDCEEPHQKCVDAIPTSRELAAKYTNQQLECMAMAEIELIRAKYRSFFDIDWTLVHDIDSPRKP